MVRARKKARLYTNDDSRKSMDGRLVRSSGTRSPHIGREVVEAASGAVMAGRSRKRGLDNDRLPSSNAKRFSCNIYPAENQLCCRTSDRRHSQISPEEFELDEAESSPSAHGLKQDIEPQPEYCFNIYIPALITKHERLPLKLDALNDDVIYRISLQFDSYEDTLAFAQSFRKAAEIFKMYPGSIIRNIYRRKIDFPEEAFAVLQMTRQQGISPVANAYMQAVGKVNHRFYMRLCQNGQLPANVFSFGKDEVERLKVNRSHVIRLIRSYLRLTHLSFAKSGLHQPQFQKRVKDLFTFREWNDTIARYRFVFYFLLEMAGNFHLKELPPRLTRKKVERLAVVAGAILFDCTRLLEQRFVVLIDILWICKKLAPEYQWAAIYDKHVTAVLEGIMHRVKLTESEDSYEDLVQSLSSKGAKQGLRWRCGNGRPGQVSREFLESRFYLDGKWQLPGYFEKRDIMTVDGKWKVVRKEVMVLIEGLTLPSISFLLT